ncbi:beta-3 adrenergic receptor-like [Acanthaster planci]|uniref:Beta-3 adrenergic receptor-like n=1 Tax=Acanthaster planci TaxID=133434 RepID=A0A8B7ZUM1_ACAPL|nr:beta-3 adrenergic receptor-like [Acanthaster planci]
MPDEGPSPPWFNVFRCILLSLTTVLIIGGNSFCLLILRRVHGIHEVTRLFMASLALSDLLTGVFVALPMVVSTAMDRWPYGDTFCGIYGVGKYVCYYTGLISLIAVTVERYIMVVCPLRYHTIVTLFRARVAVAVIWLLALAITMFFGGSVNFVGDVDEDEDNCSLDTEKGDFWHYPLKYMAVVFILVPVVTVLVLYTHILLIARRQICRIAAVAPLGPMSEEERAAVRTRQANRRAAGTFLIVTMAFAVAWMPSAVRKLNKLATGISDTMYTEFLARFCMLSNSWLNIFVYYIRNESFRQTARRYIAAIRGTRTSDAIEISY